MERVGFVTYKESANLSDSDQLLVTPMAKYGYEVLPVAWDDESIDWTKYKSLVFRSCWNYHYNTEKFEQWLTQLQELNIKTWNPVDVVKWNMSKKYLNELHEKYSIDIIPTIYLEKGSTPVLKDIMQSSNWNEVVVKPSIGASAYKIFKSTLEEADQNQSSFNELSNLVDVMVQPLIPELVNYGETSMIFLNKKFSHAVNRRPKKGDFRSNYEFGGIETKVDPDQSIINTAQEIVDKIESQLLYARVDGVETDGKFLLMELELIEPYLFLDLAPEANDNFAFAFNEVAKI